MSEHSVEKPACGGLVRWLVALAVVVVLAAVGIFFWKNVIGGVPQEDVQSKVHSKPISRLVVAGDSGEVDVVKGDKVHIEATLEWQGERKPVNSQKWDGETLRVEEKGCRGAWDFVGECGITYRIEVPSDVDLEVRVDAGNITTSGIKGEQRLESDSGNIDVSDAGKALTVKADSGNVTGTDLAGTKVNVTLDSGQIDLGFSKAPSQVRAVADSGSVTVQLPEGDEGYDVHAETDSGTSDVEVSTDSTSSRRINVETGSGSVTVEYA
ncbi:DUF4097 family beta strand repeat-containing protein [Stackebrandtia nassauensis]|uniref:DUF4097 domain-containing protein n=1 Tax=Stackebrandtia nassauensis (strain DSM 44728 / CIP 108903 / NRRL B-16338 / NBRC 102104 / LLR-40K-21) TaxID=446470 RepID=D3PX55_STANL|nr:DUF4097 family beta strand repeat-containing protein [Stackebrandtia nassauensis]ADD45279.1 hypothetical protein Snas_5649 [Stackebrandtia nassauensis DSM 44728]